MAKINIDGAQNVEVSKQIPCIKSKQEQLLLMEAYTDAHHQSEGMNKATRELNCLKSIYPSLFRPLEDGDLIAGRLDFLPIGFGSVTSVGGVGHYCVFHKLRAFKDDLPIEEHQRVDKLYDYWQEFDVKTLYCQDVLTENTIGRFIDCSYPMMATARLSGMMLQYKKLMKLGIPGLKQEIQKQESNDFLRACSGSLDLLVEIMDEQMQKVNDSEKNASNLRKKQLDVMYHDLDFIKNNAPKTFHQALQLFWIYSLSAGVINYGRLDDVLGPFLQHDLDNNVITNEEAYQYLLSLWTLIENRRTTVNGRIIVGGMGREHVEAADTFTRLCLQVCKATRYVEPQFTLRIYEDTPKDILDMAYDCIGSGATYPTLYNDEVNVKAVEYSMDIQKEDSKQYVPFGCGEFVIQGKSVGTPNTLLNLLKLLNLTLNKGIDPMDGKQKVPSFKVKDIETFETFEDLYSEYKKVLDYYFDLSIEAQVHSYKVMNREVSFLFTSIIMDDCIGRGKAVLDGGIEYLGGTNETYGNINTSDALYAIQQAVYVEKKYTLKELCNAALHNFVGYEDIQSYLLKIPKYGNDHDACDALANDLFEYVAKGISTRGTAYGMSYYLIVISNNQTNTDWGKETSASLDGRKSRVYMNPANNPQGGAAKKGPTALLNSLAVFQAKYHGGSVQNIKFTPRMFNEDRDKIKVLFDTYFKRGGCQLMISVVGKGDLEDAQKHPERHQDLIVRVAGYSAVFVNLSKDIQEELMSRELYD